MLAKLSGSILHGAEALLITIEVSVTKGIGHQITGLPGETIKESLSRIAMALHHNGYQMPRTKLLIHLGPANIRKSGSSLDLPIALGILQATEQIKDMINISDYLIAGELGLDGQIKSIRGPLCMSELSLRRNLKGLVIPQLNAAEAALIPGAKVFGISALKEAIAIIEVNTKLIATTTNPLMEIPNNYTNDFKHVVGQTPVKRALEIAAAGGHHLLMSGFPGTGKSMLAKCLPSILPPMEKEEIIETTKIHSLSSKISIQQLLAQRPFREVHHTISTAGLIGGGLLATPGEISLAHNGVLFLDEFTECKAAVLEALRQPLEEKKILIARSAVAVEYPASFMLVAAMNPCLCGFHGHPTKKCKCSKNALWWHRRKLSGPITDRFDLRAVSELTNADDIFNPNANSESSAIIRARVINARQKQQKRYRELNGIHTNAQLSHGLIEKYCAIDDHTKRFLQRSWTRLDISMRGLDKILKVARSIADLDNTDNIELAHVAEAMFFKFTSLDDDTEKHQGKNKGTNNLYPV